MEKKEKISGLWQRVWRVVMVGILMIMLVELGLAVKSYTEEDYEGLAKFLPAETEVFLVVEEGGVNLGGVWGELWMGRWERIREEGGVVARVKEDWIYFFKEGNEKGEKVLKSEDYGGYELENLIVGEGSWRFRWRGWEVFGERKSLVNLIDYWNEGGESLDGRRVFSDLREIVRGEADLRVYGFFSEDGVGDVINGFVARLEEGEGGVRVEMVSLLNKEVVGGVGWGEERERWKGEGLGRVEEGVCWVVGGRGVGDYFEKAKEVLGGRFGLVEKVWKEREEGWVSRWWWDLFKEGEEGVVFYKKGREGAVFARGEKLFGRNLKGESYALDREEVGDGGGRVWRDWIRMRRAGTRWGGLIYPENCVGEWVGWLEGYGVVWVGQQVFDDRIVTEVYAEKRK